MKFNKQLGQASRLLLVLAAVVLVAAIITYLIIRMAERPVEPKPTPGDEVEQPVYEQNLGNIRFVFQSALDKDGVLRASEIKNSQYTYQKNDLLVSNLGAKFIQVTVGAQNIGTVNTVQNAWDIENIVDDKGRNFVPLDYQVGPWLPIDNSCGALLKPAFDPTLCTKIYEVSKESAGLKIRVKSGRNNNVVTSGSAEEVLIDLIVK